MLKTVTAIVFLAAGQAWAQSALLDAVATVEEDVPAAAPMPEIEIRSWTIPEAVAARDRLLDDILVLDRIFALQTSLLEVNALRVGIGATPLTLPGRICAASPLARLCGRLVHTFEPPGEESP